MTDTKVLVGKDTIIREMVNIYGKGKIGSGTNIAAFVEIGDPDIGDDCKIEAFAYIPPGVHIGNKVFIGPHVCFTNDKYPKIGNKWDKMETVVGDEVSIGANVTILPGVRIGDGVVIGAGAVVTKDVPAHLTVVGNPAMELKK